MSGMKLEYDEDGEKFFYFILPCGTLVLLLLTCYFWPSKEESDNVSPPKTEYIWVQDNDNYQLVPVKKPDQSRQILLTKIGFVITWIVFFILVFRIPSSKIQHEEYDPFTVLNIDHDASVREIKRVYHELSKIHHPDRGGDPEKFKEISKAYRTLTDEEAKENWRKYGNPDGPRELRFGFAIPKWFVERENSMFVLLCYTSLFMIILPILVVCLLK